MLSPLPENLSLVGWFFLVVQFLHLACAGFILGGSGVSFLLDAHGARAASRPYRQLAADLLRQAIPHQSFFFLLPLLAALNLVCLQLAFAPTYDPLYFRVGELALLLAGLGSLFFFRRRLLGNREGSAAGSFLTLAGLAALLAAYYLLFCEGALLVRPERWPVLPSVPERALSWSATAQFGLFGLFALASAALALLALSRRSEKRSEGYVRTARRTGVTVAMFALLLWPLLLLLDLVNMPSLAFSTPFFIAVGAVVLLAAILAWRLAGCWAPEAAGGAVPLLAGLLCLFLLQLFSGHIARGNVLIPQTMQRTEAKLSPVAEEGEAAAGVEEESEEEGEAAGVSGKAVFDRVCSNCHTFDHRVVGPPLHEVVPAYEGDREKLKAFIRDPQKKNPDYPAMPNLGLSEEEIDAVAGFLLEKAGGE